MKKIKQLAFLLVLIALSTTAIQAQKTIMGTVSDLDTKEALVGASVLVKGTTKGALTNENGQFTLEVPKEATVLVVSYVGYESKEVAMSESSFDIQLSSGAALENIVVIGSRNATRTKIETAVPVDVIAISQVADESGQVDLNQLLNYVAPSFQSSRQTISDGSDHVDPAQLRGLGPDQVLVLVNGKRRHQSALVNVNGTINRGTVGTDLNAIPAQAIERIEILRDGAAAQYGSDAITGVINIVLKKKEGLTARVAYGSYITEYPKHYAWNLLNPTQKKEELTPVVDGGNTAVSLNYGLKIGQHGFFNITADYNLREATNRTGLFTGQVWPLVGGKNMSDSINTAKGLTRDDFSMRVGNSKVGSAGIVYNFSIPLSKRWELYSFGGYNNKKGESGGIFRYPTTISSASTQTLWTKAGGGREKVFALYPNGFLPLINSDVSDISAIIGARGKIGTWDMDISQNFGQSEFLYKVSNSVNYTQAVDTTYTGALQTQFNAGGSQFRQLTSNVDFAKNHPVLEGLNTAFGAEYREDAFSMIAGEEASYKNYNTKSNVASGAQVFPGFLKSNEGTFKRHSVALYTDNELDITKKWLVSAALRFENYSDFGSTFNYKFSSRYKITDNLTVRGSTSTGFRAPSQQQKYYAKTNTLFTTAGIIESGTFTNDSKVAEILGIPKLKQETSLSYTAGFTARVKEFELTVDAYQIDIKDRIILTNNFTANGDAALTAQLAAAGATTANVFTNAIDTRSRGLESVLSYEHKFAKRHTLKFVVAGTLIRNHVRDSSEVIEGNTSDKPFIKATETLIRTNQASTSYYNREDESRMEVASPLGKVSMTANYRYKNLSVMLRGVYFGKATLLDPNVTSTNPADSLKNSAGWPVNLFTGKRESLDQEFSGKWVFDMTVGYQITKQLNFMVGANNLFDTYQDAHTHYGNTSLGRYIYTRRVNQMGVNGRYLFGRFIFKLK
ncbi:MAG: TonB-dependent receptor [Saprospiraceae bacterium]|nr:TonB-dependent receptor [Saprospiraceae bacterium]